jgi:benzoyl-CoA reductase subunit C
LEGLGGQHVESDRLNRSISLYNENRRLLSEIDKIRAGKPWTIPSYEYYLLNRAGYVLEVEEHNRLLTEYISGLTALNRKPLDNIRVVLIGAFCEQPPLGLIKAIEMAGCYIVWDDFVLGNRFITSDIDDSSDNPFKAISDAFLFHSVFSSSKYEAGHPKNRVLVEIVRNRKADGVILAGPSFCDPILLDHPDYCSELDREGIPYITFLYAEDMAQFQVIDEEVGTFSDSIRIWG